MNTDFVGCVSQFWRVLSIDGVSGQTSDETGPSVLLLGACRKTDTHSLDNAYLLTLTGQCYDVQTMHREVRKMPQTATISVTVNLPDSLVREIETTARQQQRSISAVVRELVLQGWPTLPSLPDEVEAELAAFSNLSDDVLWMLARSTLAETEQEKLAGLNHLAKQRSLTEEEGANRDALLDAYNRAVVRRAQAVLLLKAHGYDLSDPSILQ
ncbi:MAG: ribbon-helix-helix protein, CopG family [Proteobacteria bacterium]|nr:ribbon-helix-helix protein, CopG family [Pseudomonadota bacterium]